MPGEVFSHFGPAMIAARHSSACCTRNQHPAKAWQGASPAVLLYVPPVLVNRDDSIERGESLRGS